MSTNSQLETVVLKFGSSVLRVDADIPRVVQEIYRWYRAGLRVVAVVSAIGDSTDVLLARASEFSLAPEGFATAELLATGERAAAALLGVALDRTGIPARVLNPREIGLTVVGSPLDSDLSSVDAERLQALLNAVPVLIVPGFFGTDHAGRTHCLGRGGSDLTAVFLAQALNARARLVKDVDGVYTADPSTAETAAARYTSLSYVDALRVAGPLIQPKAVRFLMERSTCAEVAALARGYESLVHAGPTELAPYRVARGRLRVALLGLGTVGGGVYSRLLANSECFEFSGALVRDREKSRDTEVPAPLLHINADGLLDLHPDVVVDALPGELSLHLTEHALDAGIHVVSANKRLIAEHGSTLQRKARGSGAILSYSASVGGGTPMLELVDRVRDRHGISHLTAVLNGTCNYILDASARGLALDEAISEAQSAGFAESDATEDLSGRDAERKLRILCRHAFDAEPETISIERLDGLVAARSSALAGTSSRLRQVARASRQENAVRGSVRFEVVSAESPLGNAVREWNAIEVIDAAGHLHYAAGRGAGRWPTAEAVMADLFDLYRRLTSRAGRFGGLFPEPS